MSKSFIAKLVGLWTLGWLFTIYGLTVVVVSQNEVSIWCRPDMLCSVADAIWGAICFAGGWVVIVVALMLFAGREQS